MLAGNASPESPAPPAPPTIPRRPADAPVPLSFSQRRLWFFHQLDPQSPLYNLPIAHRLSGPLDVSALQRALDAIVARHEMLRTRFVEEDGVPVQKIEPPSGCPLREVELRSLPASEREPRVRALLDEECRRPFDLTRDSLLRAVLARTDTAEHTLILTTHHIAADGWSWGVFFRELAANYEAELQGKAERPLPLSIQVGDFAHWQQERVRRGIYAADLAYWKQRLAGAPALLALPTDHPRPAAQTFRGAWVQRPLSPELTAGLRSLARREGATLFMVLLSAFKVLLHRWSGQADLVVGAAVSGRTQTQLEDLVGCFVNTLPLRSDLSGNPAFLDFLRQVRSTSLDALSHQEVPFDQLVEELRPVRHPGYSPLVQVMFSLQDDRGGPPRLRGLTATRLDTTTDTAKFDLLLMVSEGEHTLTPILEYNRDLFDAATAERWLGYFETLLSGIVADAGRRLSALPLLTAAEHQQLLHDWSGTVAGYPRDATIVQLFEAQVALNPEAIAVEFGRERVSYRELDRRADRLARWLRALGVGPDVPVALCLERSVELVVALLGILKAGGAYASIDPDYPAERVSFMLSDLQAPVVITQSSLRPRLPATVARVLLVEEMPEETPSTDPAPPRPTAENLAYISYTSGSTGQPKGVAVPHRGVVRLVRGTNYASFSPTEVFLLFAPVGFDASTFEIWGALLNGARLVVAPPGMPPLAELGALIAACGITTLWLTAGLFHAMVDEAPDSLRGVKQLLAGGDTLSPTHVEKLLRRHPQCRLINGYGPTENTTFTCCHTVTVVDGPIPIGRPIAHTEICILDENRQPAPIGSPGELWVGGDGLARGYLNRPELTAEKFVPHPFKPGARLYRTGDLVRQRSDGALAFLGRIDRQVKLRGFRVELEEIEAQLARLPRVRHCVVTAPSDAAGERRLIAHVVADDGLTPAALRESLAQKLPAPFIPSAFVFLPALPLTANGKVDQRALPAPESEPAARPATVPPRDACEEKLVRLWETVLGVSPIGVTDRFFELGGHSLLALRLVAQIETAFQRRLSVSTIFQAQTVAQLAALLRDDVPTPATTHSLVALQPKGRRAPLYLVHGVGGGMLWGYINLSRHLGEDQPVYVFRAMAPAAECSYETIEAMAARYVRELRAFQPEGPYSLGGYCFGGQVAFEMARLLEAQGQKVALLALMNASPPNSSYGRFRWTPLGLGRFTLNLARWVSHFLTWDRKVRDSYVRWKLLQWRKRAAGWCGHGKMAPSCGPEGIVNLTALPKDEHHLYVAHLRALAGHRCQPYGGQVTVLRTRGHPLVCSFDPLYGWGEFARGVRLRHAPGAHESLLQEPNVAAVAQILREEADATGIAARPAGLPPRGQTGS